MRVLVTGGTGFIGAAVVDELHRRNHAPRVFDRTLGFDIRNAESVNEAVEDMDAVIHLAGVLGTDELFDTVQYAVDVNIKGTINVLEACVDYGAKYIGITMPPVFPSIYTATKVSSSRFATAYHHNYDLPVTHIRAFNAFGPNQHHGSAHPRKIIPAFSVEGWNNVPLKIWGDGEQTVDLIHTDDIARIFVDALENAPGDDETIDAGTGVEWTVNEVACFVLEITGSSAGVKHHPMRRGEIPTQIVAQGEGWQYINHAPVFSKLDLMKTVVSYRGIDVQ